MHEDDGICRGEAPLNLQNWRGLARIKMKSKINFDFVRFFLGWSDCNYGLFHSALQPRRRLFIPYSVIESNWSLAFDVLSNKFTCVHDHITNVVYLYDTIKFVRTSHTQCVKCGERRYDHIIINCVEQFLTFPSLHLCLACAAAVFLLLTHEFPVRNNRTQFRATLVVARCCSCHIVFTFSGMEADDSIITNNCVHHQTSNRCHCRWGCRRRRCCCCCCYFCFASVSFTIQFRTAQHAVTRLHWFQLIFLFFFMNVAVAASNLMI